MLQECSLCSAGETEAAEQALDCGGWKLQLRKSDWDKSQRLKVFGRLYFDIQFIFIYLFGWWWCDWDFCDPLVYDSYGI